MAKLTVQPITPDGLDLDDSLAAAAAAGDNVDSASGLLLWMKNADVGPHTLTIDAPVATAQAGGFGSQAIADIVVAVPAGESRGITIPAGYAVLGVVSWTYDDETGVSVGVFSLAANE